MNLIENMTGLRDLALALPERLNPLLGPDHSFAYSRLFVFAQDGFGYYPRFRLAHDWGEALEQRIEVFRKAIASESEKWSDFLNWWPGKAEGEDLKQTLLGDLARVPAPELYEMLLGVMLTTPASWGDHHYWLMQKHREDNIEPFLAKWDKTTPDKPWHLTVSHPEEGQIVELGQADVIDGSLPPVAAHFAPIFWKFLYPLCNREKFSPPQDPAKYATGSILELILPIRREGSHHPTGWAMCHVQSNSRHEKLFEILSSPPVVAELRAFENSAHDFLNR